MPRLFTGLEIPPEVALALSAFRGGLPGARWVEPESYHVTLRFIGDVEAGTARAIDAALRGLRPRGPLAVNLDRLEAFGGARPRAVFARVVPSEGLSDLQAEQERLMRRIDLEPETRKFTPHVTLARLRGASAADVAGYIARLGLFPPLSFVASRFALYSARQSIGGGPYVIEAVYPFG